jgi:hypothetical protein
MASDAMGPLADFTHWLLPTYNLRIIFSKSKAKTNTTNVPMKLIIVVPNTHYLIECG